MTPDYAWAHREGRKARYDNKRVGGTICVHFIKKNMWFLETALAFLEMQDTTELEMRPSEPDEDSGPTPPGSGNADPRKSRPRPGSASGHREDPVVVEPDSANPNTRNGHNVPIASGKDMRVLLAQASAERLRINMEGGRGGSGGSVVLPADELEWSEGDPGGDDKRGVDSDTRGERKEEGNMSMSSTGHFANGSRRVNKR